MWKPEHRRAAERNDLRYPSDLTDAEWAIVEPMIPPGRHGGRKRPVNVREVLNGIFYVLWTAANGRRCPRIAVSTRIGAGIDRSIFDGLDLEMKAVAKLTSVSSTGSKELRVHLCFARDERRTRLRDLAIVQSAI
jgi:hypothetical protein